MTTWLPLILAGGIIVLLLRTGRVLAALVAIAVAGGALQNHVLALPGPIATPLSAWTRDLHAWQRRQSDALACEVSVERTTTTTSSPPVPGC